MNTRSWKPYTNTGRRVLPLGLVLAVLMLLSSPVAALASTAIDLDVIKGKSQVIRQNVPIKRISITDTDIADVVEISPKEVQVNGIKIGTTTLIIWDKYENKTFFDVNVVLDNAALEESIMNIAPGDDVQVKVLNDQIIVTGEVSSVERLTGINELLRGYETDSKVKMISLVQVPNIPQVLLQITVASIDRNATRSLGINWDYIGRNAALFSTTASAFQFDTLTNFISGSEGVTGDLSVTNSPNFGVLHGPSGTAWFLRALSGKGLAKILAEPNLLVKSGSTGTFLAGGEIPIPVANNISTGQNTAITIQYKEFGIRMNFTPTVSESGLIHLAMGRPPKLVTTTLESFATTQQVVGESGIEVSSLDFANAVTTAGFRVPAIKKDAVSTELDLREGESFIIAGLINSEWSKSLDKFPILGDIPIIGAFFRDQSMQKTERELVFLVTPKIMTPMEPGKRVELPGTNEPTAAQQEDLRWIPMLPTYRSNDAEQLR